MKPSPPLTRLLKETCSHLLHHLPGGWTLEGRRIRQGYCHHLHKLIVIPNWVLQDSRAGYLEWYLSHELAHARSKKDETHGRAFLQQLKRICPPEFLHFEEAYKK